MVLSICKSALYQQPIGETRESTLWNTRGGEGGRGGRYWKRELSEEGLSLF